jgi:hypothetical protein
MSAAIIPFPRREPIVQSVRSPRWSDACKLLVPNILGLLWEHGVGCARDASMGFEGGLSVQAYLGENGFGNGVEYCDVRVWLQSPHRKRAKQVMWFRFDLRVPGEVFLYHRPKRGDWEDRILAEPVKPRTFAQVAASGLVRSASVA